MTTILTEGDIIRAEIQAHPEDDSLRLIYADWIEDHGNPIYAEFIRVQIELYRLEESIHDKVVSHLSFRGGDTPAAGCNCLPCQLRHRERAAWRAKEEYVFVIPPVEPPGSYLGDFLYSELHCGKSAILWRRGFPHTVVCNWKTWKEFGKDLATQHPICVVKILDKPTAFWNSDTLLKNARKGRQP